MGKKLNYATAILFLSRYMRRYKRNFLMFYFGWLFDTILTIAMPILFGVMIDEIVYYKNIHTFIEIALVFIVLTVLNCIMYFFIYAQHSYLMNMYTFDIRMDLFKHLQKADAQRLSDISTGDIISTIDNYAGECMHFVIRNIIHAINGIIQTIAVAVYLFIIDWRIGFFALMGAPISAYVSAKFGKKVRQCGDRQRECYGKYISWIFEVFSSLRDIRMLGALEKVNKVFEKNHRDMFSTQVRSGVFSLTAQNIVSFINLTIKLVIFAFSGYLAISGNVTVGLLTIIVAFYEELTYGIRLLSSSYLDAQNRVSYIQHIYDFLQTPTEDKWSGSAELKVTKGAVKFTDVHFAYEKGNTVLDGFSFHINPGECFAFAGKSGCGKTTMAYMLIGFYCPQGGYIEVDGQKLSDCSLQSIRKNIGLIQQDVLLFDGTIRENMLLGDVKATDEAVESACRAAGLWNFIESLPNKLDTVVGSKGLGISGGQRQRVAIARIYLKNPKVIIFDEATSSVDQETEETIHESWKEVLQGRTAIVIAHRQASVMRCDKVALMEEGRVAEFGTPGDMVKYSEMFKKLFVVKE